MKTKCACSINFVAHPTSLIPRPISSTEGRKRSIKGPYSDKANLKYARPFVEFKWCICMHALSGIVCVD